MSEEGKEQTVEEIVLELKTNFDEVLNKNVASYTSFEKNVGRISRTIESNVNAMYSQVTSNLSSMLSSSQSTISKSVEGTRAAMKSIQNESSRLSKAHIDTLDRLEQLDRKIKDVMNGDNSDEVKALDMEEYLNKAKQAIDDLDKETNIGFSKIAKGTSDVLLKASQNTLASVKATAKGVIHELKASRSAIEVVGTTETVVKGSSGVSDAKTKLKELQRTINEQKNKVIAAEKEMLDAKKAYLDATDEAVKESNRKRYVSTVKNLERINKHYQWSEQQVANFKNEVDKITTAVDKGANTNKRDIQLKIDGSALKEQFDAIVANYEKSASMAGRGINKGLADNAKAGIVLRDTLKETENELKSIRAEALALSKTGFVNTEEEQKQLNDMLSTIKKFENEFKDLRKVSDKALSMDTWLEKIGKVSKEIKALKEQVKSASKIELMGNNASIIDMQEQQTRINSSETLNKQLLKKRKELESESLAIARDAAKTRIQISKETNEKQINILNEYLDQLITQNRRVKSEISRITIPDNSAAVSNLKAVADNTVKNIKATFDGVKQTPKEFFNNIHSEFTKIEHDFNRLSKKRFLNKDTVKSFENNVEVIKTKIKEYKDQILLVEEEMKKLIQLNKMGLAPNAGSQIAAMKEQQRHFRSMSQDLERMSKNAANKIEAVHRKSAKNVGKNAWEAVRNFRWQIAAIVYLVNRAVMTVKRVFLSVLNDIQSFRKDAMSIAASTAFAMLGDMKTNYASAYKYSRQLMQQLEVQAARTILTLEDMTMLTKTFAQAGMVPKSEDEVRKISTIGTAIKALTEGMANAGVQMRQELYAVIQGRQRATDQLAMMFKMMGINITEVIDKAKKEGVGMIDALSGALEPFEEMNRVLGDEYATQINRLGIIWDRIKRIGGENTLELMAKWLKQINDSLFTSDHQLTKLGMELARVVGMVMDTIALTTMSIGNMLAAFKPFLSDTTSLLATFDAINGIIWTISSAFDAIVSAGMDVVKMLALILTLDVKGIIYFESETKKAFGRAIKSGGELLDSHTRLANMTNKITVETLELGDALFSLPHKLALGDELIKLDKKIKSVTKAAYNDNEKIEYQFEIDMASFKEIKEQVTEDLKALAQKSAEMTANGTKLTAKQKENWSITLEGFTEYLSKIALYEKMTIEKRDKALKEWRQKQREEQARMLAEYENFIEGMGSKELTPDQKVEKRFSKLRIELEKLIVTNELFAKSADELRAALKKAYSSELVKANEEITQSYNKLMEKIKGKGDITAIEKIRTQFKKLREDIRNDASLSIEHKVAATYATYEAENKRITEQIEKDMEKVAKATRKTNRELENMLEKLTAFPKTKMGALSKELDSLKLDLDQFIREHNLKGQTKTYLESLFESYSKIRESQVLKGIQDQYESLMDSLNSHKAVDPITRITNEFDKMRESIARNNDLSSEQIANYVDATYAAEEQRKAIARITEELKLQETVYEAMAAKASRLQNSYRPSDQAKGDSIAASTDYARQMEKLDSEIKRINELYGESNPEYAKKYVENIKIQMKELGYVYQEQLDKIHRPFYAELEELSKGWFDSFNDMLGEALAEWKGFGDAWKSLLAQMRNDVAKAFVRQAITNPLKDMAGSMFFGGDKSKQGEEGPQQPALDVLKETFTKTWESTKSIFLEGWETIVDVATKAFDGLKDILMQMFSSDNTASIASTAFGAIGGAVGGGAPSYSGSPTQSGGTGQATVGMAEGGIIPEPVIGRGMNTGTTYTFAEDDSERVLTPDETRAYEASKGNSTSVSMPITIGDPNSKSKALASEIRRMIEPMVIKIVKEHS